MTRERDDKQITRDFKVRRDRQLMAIATTLLLLLFLILLNERPNLFGPFSKDSVVLAQILVIATFIGFSAFNWRCPFCKKYLGADINRRICRRCGTRLQ